MTKQTSKKLAQTILKRLWQLEQDRAMHTSAFGDARGVCYHGEMEVDLKELAALVLEDEDHD